jgi:2,4-diaminopentanoate dehydrogenase
MFMMRAHAHISYSPGSPALSIRRMTGEIRIGLCGLGSIGKYVAKLLLDHRRGFEIVGAATKEPEAIGQHLSQVVGAQTASGPTVVEDLADVLAENPAVVVYSTGSFLRHTTDDIIAVASARAHLVSPCEELAFPFNRFSPEAERIDRAAREHGVTIVGTGVNPGFIFDALLTTATGVCWDIEAIRGRRVVDVTGFGENIHLRLGIGYTPDEFERGHEDGSIAGHVGFPESIEMVCERLGLDLDGPVQETFEPLIAKTAAPTRYGEVSAGRTEGFIQRAIGTVGGESRVQLELVLHLRPRDAGFEPSDSIEIDGIHPVRLTLKPGMDAILATSAQLVNCIPVVLNSTPGLKSVKDLPPTAAWLGDLSRAVVR